MKELRECYPCKKEYIFIYKEVNGYNKVKVRKRKLNQLVLKEKQWFIANIKIFSMNLLKIYLII